jgi:hypothetical protein
MNKNLTILLLALLSGFALHAQTQQGSQLLGGSFLVNHTKSTGTSLNPQTNSWDNTSGKTNSFGVGPSYTYFIGDNLGLGGGVSYSHSLTDSFTDERTDKLTSNGYFASLSLMKYFLFEKMIGIRTGPYAQYDNSTSKRTSPEPFNNFKQEYKTFTAGINLDFVYFPAKKIGLVASMGSLGYSVNKRKDNYSTNKDNSIGFSFFNTPSFSVYYVLGK